MTQSTLSHGLRQLEQAPLYVVASGSQGDEALAGIRTPTGGAIRLAGRDVAEDDPARRRRLGLAHVPEDRLKLGVVAAFAAAAGPAWALDSVEPRFRPQPTPGGGRRVPGGGRRGQRRGGFQLRRVRTEDV